MEKVADGVAWRLRERGTPHEKDLSELRRIGEALAKAAIKRKEAVPED
ncbi:MAG: hypothetical protein ACUVQY_01185 [Thermoproteota archaeon]